VLTAPLLLSLLLYSMAVSAPHGERLGWLYDSCFVRRAPLCFSFYGWEL
jgi:hypothetical protein